MSLIKISIGLILIIAGLVLMYQGPFNNTLEPLDELIESATYLTRTVLLPLILILSGGFIIKTIN